MDKLISVRMLLMVVIPASLVACAPSAEQLKATVTAAMAALPTYTPYPTYTPAPTYTLPPTQTPEIVVITATISPTPQFEVWSTDQVVAALQEAGLEFENPRLMQPDDYGLAPMTAKMGIRFLIPSLCSDCGGRLFSFDSQIALEAIKAYYEMLGQGSGIYFSWVFVRDNILIQINGDLPEEQARRYEQALNSLGN